MLLNAKEKPVLIVNLIYIPALTAVALRNLNYEFVLYVCVIIALFVLILLKQRTVRFELPVLWGLTLWGMLHMMGGNLRVGGDVLYSLQLIPNILRFDQFVHFVGFGIATLVCHHLLRSHLKPDQPGSLTLAVLVVLMGSGAGALNEIVEFIAVKTVPETGVGGYENTMWDLVFNLLGGVAAVAYLSLRPHAPSPAVSNSRIPH